MLNLSLHQNLHISQAGAEALRSYFVPHSKTQSLHAGYGKSDRILSLNGKWKFFYCRNASYLPENAFQEDFDCSTWNAITVPSTWQSEGYDHYHYSNLEYCIPYNPPFVPFETPCAFYLRDVELTDPKDYAWYLTFEGVDPCCYLWINGNFVGYHQVSHSFFEFNVTRYIKAGNNRISILVFKWCDGTYLECQDKMRLTGIFGNVGLLKRPKYHIRDYKIKTTVDDSSQAAVIYIDVDCPETLPCCFELHNPDHSFNQKGILTKGVNRIFLQNPLLWNEETPALYTLCLISPDEIIEQYVGIRTIDIRDGVFLLNGKPLKLHGVNRHEVHPKHGYVFSQDEMLEEILLMKTHNVNVIRTSHYPANPYLYYLCDLYGIYVIDEADLEAHGIIKLYAAGSESNRLIADNPDFLEAILFRERSLIERDKNHPCVIIWSMGNETGYGKNMEIAASMIRALDSTRPINYESSTHPIMHNDINGIDLISRMYLPIDTLNNELQTYQYKKPLLLTEYCHCMGNSPGDFEEYHKIIYDNPGMLGGCVWEWRDQAMNMGADPSGQTIYCYGGDYGDFPNCSNFCIDGIIFADGKPHTGLKEHKNVYRPIRIYPQNISNGLFEAECFSCFTNPSETYDFIYSVSQNGTVVSVNRIPCPPIPYRKRVPFTLPYELPENGRCYLYISTVLRSSCNWADKNFEVGFEQFELPVAGSCFTNIAVYPEGKIEYEESYDHIAVYSDYFEYRFHKYTGSLDFVQFGGQLFIDSPVAYQIWRAPTDNDRYIRVEWEKAGYDRIINQVEHFEVNVSTDEISISFHLKLTAVALQPIGELYAKYTVSNTGILDVNIQLTRNLQMPWLPRFGICLELPVSMNEVTYFGYGPFESYCDKHHSSYMGLFHSSVNELFENYVNPQENGSHWNCEYLSLKDTNKMITVTSQKPFTFNASPYTPQELTLKTHSYQLIPSDKTILCLDCQHSGIGSASCGPNLNEKYQINSEHIYCHFNILFKEEQYES